MKVVSWERFDKNVSAVGGGWQRKRVEIQNRLKQMKGNNNPQLSALCRCCTTFLACLLQSETISFQPRLLFLLPKNTKILRSCVQVRFILTTDIISHFLEWTAVMSIFNSRLSRPERRYRACVVCNAPGSNPSLPDTFQLYQLDRCQ